MDLVQKCFGELRREHDGIMVFLCREHSLYLWKWNSFWKPKEGISEQVINLEDQKTPFHVVSRINVYHGPVLKSDSMKALFQSWGLEKWPHLLTLVGVRDQEKIYGVVLCVGYRGSKINLSQIDFISRISQNILPELKKAVLNQPPPRNVA